MPGDVATTFAKVRHLKSVPHGIFVAENSLKAGGVRKKRPSKQQAIRFKPHRTQARTPMHTAVIAGLALNRLVTWPFLPTDLPAGWFGAMVFVPRAGAGRLGHRYCQDISSQR